ncbi:Hypothetical_protein [Hexamita inflata]|uniref:Hypothetical_protein n=1 Tax=Hexamita inflata TaxID=28002 RepID=A0AA86RA93_9EUKA|nr:Hypothetical protein HINF_LOCUS56514 [Hexamita inflata]
MLLLCASIADDAISFSQCFSTLSYVNGNDLTKQLSLHLIPFEILNLITEENLCKIYLPGKTVVTQIHFDDVSFFRKQDKSKPSSPTSTTRKQQSVFNYLLRTTTTQWTKSTRCTSSGTT